jgi:DDE superfamily endonuclease
MECTARSTGKFRVCCGRPSKMSSQQRVLNALMYLKHDNTVHFEAFQWNWAKSSVSDDASFVCSVINAVLGNEITWPNENMRAVLANRIPGFRGCIGLIDGTLCKIRRPYRNPDHARWFNGQKQLYSMNSTVIVDHDGLFIYVDPGYPGSFHDVTILRQSELSTSWRDYFTHSDEYIEYL